MESKESRIACAGGKLRSPQMHTNISPSGCLLRRVCYLGIPGFFSAMPFFSLSPRAVSLPDRKWGLRDWVAAVALVAATAGVVLWQNAHVAVLFDLSYILNAATRIAQGQMPYRDFPLPHAPLTFLVEAAIIRLTGRVFFHQVLYVAIVGGLGTVLTWRIALEMLRGRVAAAWTVALLVAAPLVFVGIYCIVPNPEYDCDCAFWILVAVWLLQKLDARTNLAWGFAAGGFICVPLFLKQNMGLPFLAAAVGAVLLVLAMRWLQPNPRKPRDFKVSVKSKIENAAPRGQTPAAAHETLTLLSVLAGAGAALAAAVLALHWTAGIGNYVQWTIRYAAHRRLPGSGDMLGVYSDPSLLWTVPSVAAGLVLLSFRRNTAASGEHCFPTHSASFRRKAAEWMGQSRWLQIAAFALLAAPFLFTLAALLIYDDADSRGDSLLALWPLLLLYAAALAIANLLGLWREPRLRALMPLILLAAIHGTFMSQQLWGSTYAIWPLLALLVAEMLAFLGRFTARAASRWFVPALAALVSFTFLVCGGLYTASEERLSYAYLPAGPPAHSAFPQLAGLATPGPYLPEIDELLRYAQANIPFNDGLVLVPGEEPFYFATGRVARFPLPFFDPTIDPYSPAEIASLVQSRNIRWLIVKTDVQTKVDPTPDRAALMDALMGEFTLAAHLHGYDVYRANAAE